MKKSKQYDSNLEYENKTEKNEQGLYAWTAKVGSKGQIVIPAKARKIFDINTGDNLIVLGDEGQGLAIIKEKGLLSLLNNARKK